MARIFFFPVFISVTERWGQDIPDPEGGIQAEDDQGIISWMVLYFLVIIPESGKFFSVLDRYRSTHVLNLLSLLY